MCDICDLFTLPRTKSAILAKQYNDVASPSSKSVLEKLDPFTLFVLKALPPKVIENNQNPASDVDITTEETDLGWKKTGILFDSWEKTSLKPVRVDISPKFTLSTVRIDDFFGKPKAIDVILRKAFANTCIFPLKDKIFYFNNEEECTRLMKELDFVPGKALPVTYNSNFDMLSDESFSRIFFHSLCAPLVAAQKPNDPAVRKDLGPFVVDMPYQHLKVRKMFRPYGARVHFGENQQVTAIFDYYQDTMYKPGDVGWDEAKLLAKVTSFLLVTAREHLIWAHLTLSNAIATANTLVLKPSHPLRRLLTVFTFRTANINATAMITLVNNNGILHRSTGLQHKAMLDVFDMAHEQCNIYQPFPEQELAPEIQKLVDEGNFPYISDGIALWKIIEKFVKKWVEAAGDEMFDEEAMLFYNAIKKTSKDHAYVIPEYTSSQDLVNLITQAIFVVTAYHEIAGAVADYIGALPTRSGFRLALDHGGNQIDAQSFLTASILGATTAVRMPGLTSKFENFFGVGGAPLWEREVWDAFVVELKVQSKRVKEADAKRKVEFKYFDPELLECSISV